MRQRGQMLVMAVVLIVVVALMVVTFGFLYVSNQGSSTLHSASDQAYSVSVSGLEVAAREFANGTACASLTFPGGAVPNTQVGNGTFATSGTLYPTAFTATLQAGIANNNTVPFIPLSFTVGSLTNLAPHGEILIGSEFITYSGSSNVGAACSPVAAPCLTGVTRGTNGTTIAAHAAAVAVTQPQSQCVIRSTGTFQSASRILESTVALNSNGVANLFNGGLVGLTNAATTSLTGGAWAPGLPAGDNYVIAIVTFSSTDAGGISSIPSGNLNIVATNPGVNPLVASTSIITFGNGVAPSATIFPQETQVLLAKHTGALATATYNLQVVSPTTFTASARAQILVINGITAANASYIAPGANQTITAVTNLSTSANTLPAGDNVIIAQVQIDNQAGGGGGARSITSGNLAIRRGTGTGGTVLMSNRYDINLERNNRANQGTGYLLLALDPGAAAATQYSVTGLASGNNVNASASLLVFNGFSAVLQPPITSQPPASVTFDTTMPGTSLGSVTDTFRVGERVVLSAIQYSNTSGATRNMFPGNETITLNNTAVSSPASANAYNWALCSGTATCDDFFSGLLWRESPTAQLVARPTFGVMSRADGSMGVTGGGAANILTIDLSVREINRMEIYP